MSRLSDTSPNFSRSFAPATVYLVTCGLPNRQKNGGIHFHFIVNRRFPIRSVNKLWVLQHYDSGITKVHLITAQFCLPMRRMIYITSSILLMFVLCAISMYLVATLLNTLLKTLTDFPVLSGTVIVLCLLWSLLPSLIKRTSPKQEQE